MLPKANARAYIDLLIIYLCIEYEIVNARNGHFYSYAHIFWCVYV